jgi:LTXXQ motif family protein
MTKQTSALLLAAALVAGMPVAATAQQHQHGGGKPAAAPAARPAPHAAPAPRMAPAAPRMAAPHMATPRMATPRMAAPPVAAPRAASPHVSSPRMAIQRHQSPAVNRAVQQQQFRQERARATANQERARATANQERARATTNQPPSTLKAQANANLQTQRQLQLDTRQQLRAERALRRQEARELRRLPTSQRAQRLQEIHNAREQRALDRQQLAQPNALQGQSNARTMRANRPNGTARVTQDAARKGRFAARFAERNAGINAGNRWTHFAARDAWRHHDRAHFVAWFGPVFWPYAYSDIFSYTFWPYGYEDGYWAYAYDDFFDGLFWGEAGPPADYAYAPSAGAPSTLRSRYAGAPRATFAAAQEVCRQPGNGITAWPFADIQRNVGLDADQKQLLDQVRLASQDAAAVFKASCPPGDAFPLTPPGRLDAMIARLDATLQTVQTVRPPLEKFYNSLSDEQKERFNQLGPKDTAASAQASVQDDQTCRQPKPGLANLPIEKIEDAVNPNGTQAARLSNLQSATNKAVSILQTACPEETPLTPTGRLVAMEKRLEAMVDAAKTVKPALENFYASLTNEQKARFNRIGRTLAETTGQSSN